jgi:alpha-L-fucosidase 2
VGETRVTRRTVVSHPDRALVMTIEVDGAAGLDMSLDLRTPLRSIGTHADASTAWRTVRLPDDIPPPHESAISSTPSYDDDRTLRGALAVSWSHDGTEVIVPDRMLAARGARHVTIILSTATTFAGIGRPASGDERDAVQAATHDLEAARGRGIDEVRRRQRADHAALYGRVALGFDAPDDRLREIAFLFHYGRYLLIASSRAGGLPATLQGLWNASMHPPWSSNYTVNINTQMNYWPADVTDLAECLPPLFDLVDALREHGSRTARRLYDAGGWCTHHNTDAWAYTSPIGLGAANPAWAFWPMAGVWLSLHLAQHVEFGADRAFALERAWPVIRSAAEFVLDWAIEMPNGDLGFVPSSSPENLFVAGATADGAPDTAGIDVSSAIDVALARDLFEAVLRLAPDADDKIVPAASDALGRLPPPQIAADGTVQEWYRPHRMAEPQHRHVSSLFFAFPGSGTSPGLASAVARTLDVRGDDSTGWSLAWKLALRARLKQTDRLSNLIELALRPAPVSESGQRGGLYPNRFSAHPPFQIDGNFGFTAALAECIVQSHAGAIELLPALPDDWPAGEAKGLIARPGVIVDVRWDDDRRLTGARLVGRNPDVVGVRVRQGDETVEIDFRSGATWTVFRRDGRLLAETAAR